MYLKSPENRGCQVVFGTEHESANVDDLP
jgi:hypothetical protein